MSMYIRGAGDRNLPAVLLLHGTSTTGKVWIEPFKLLQHRLRMVAPDLPGFGRSPGPFDFDEVVARLATMLDGRRVHIAGIEVGANIAIRLATAHPNLVESLFLSAFHVKFSRILSGLQTAVARMSPRSAFSHFDPEVTKETAIDVHRNMAWRDFGPELERIRARTLVVCGLKDRAHLPSAIFAVKHIPVAGALSIPEGGPQWDLQFRELFAQELLNWVYHEGPVVREENRSPID